MTMRYFEIIEARRNPSMNPKFSMLDALKKYAGKNAFVTFTDDVGSESHKWAGRSGPGGTNTSKNARGAKIGINPQYYYNTPLGIYAYPLDYALSKEGDVEFAGRRPYLWVFEPKGKVLDLATYTMNDLQKDCTRLRAKISVISVPHDIFHSAADSARVKTPGGMLWNITRMIARRKTREFFRLASDLRNVKGRRREEAYISHMDNDDGSWDADEEFYANYDDDEEIPANAITDGETAKQWGRVFQLLGYCGAVDSKGEGIIHPNEPTQAVFFSISGIRVLELVDNIAPSEPYTDIQIYTKQPMALLARIRRGMPETELIDILDQNPYLIKKIGFSNLPDETKEYVRKHHQTFAEKITEGKIDVHFPLKKVRKAYHIGTLNAGDKDRDEKGNVTSYEGEGISITTDPQEWVRIAKIGGSPLWLCEKSSGTFIDNQKLTNEHRAIMQQWADESGIKFSETADNRTAIAVAYAENVLNIDGVWWAVRTSQWNAPRGVIVPGKISTWKFTKKYEEYP